MAVNLKLPKINARESRDQAGVGGIAMKLGNRHRTSAILLGLKWSVRIFLGIPGILRIEIQMSSSGATRKDR